MAAQQMMTISLVCVCVFGTHSQPANWEQDKPLRSDFLNFLEPWDVAVNSQAQ